MYALFESLWFLVVVFYWHPIQRITIFLFYGIAVTISSPSPSDVARKFSAFCTLNAHHS